MRRLTDKVAFITGAGAGIGRCAAKLFAAEGCKVVIAERESAAGEAAAHEIQLGGHDAIALQVDVTDEVSMRNAIAQAADHYGRLDVLWNNVGGSSVHDGPVTTAANEEFWRCIQVDVFGVWLGCRYGIPELVKAGGGSVINMSSVLAVMGTPNKDAYTAAKGAISALTRSLAVEFAPAKVRVNAIAPGITRTARVQDLLARDGVTEGLGKSYLLGLLEPEDVASLALYLASNESRRMTGQILSIDSGASIC